jgi:hypothetical protein
MTTCRTVGEEEHSMAMITPAAASLASSAKSLTGQFFTWVKTCADDWAAAALYDSLRSLSDAELYRRELSRDRLARDVFRSRDHAAHG